MYNGIFKLRNLGITIICFFLSQAQVTLKAAEPIAPVSFPAQTVPIESEGVYFTDVTQTALFNGYYREYYESGDLKLEMYIKDGRPEGTYVVYFENARIKEVRSYRNGVFHGIWRTYNESGMLIAQAEYVEGKKDGVWMVWDENGVRRYEMHYSVGKKAGTWYMWDEKGMLISEKTY